VSKFLLIPDASETPYPEIPYVQNIVAKEVSSLLDVGCCKGRVWKSAYSVGCDVFLGWLKEGKKYYDDVVVCDLGHYFPFIDNAFSTVLSVAVIEHLPSDKGEHFVSEMERVGRKLVIITTPSYPSFNCKKGENPYGVHLSYWSASFFKRRGYAIRGFGF